MPDPIYSIAVELSVGSLTDITNDVTRFTFDRALATFDDAELFADSIMVELSNVGGTYSPKRNGIGAGLKAGRRIRATCQYSGTTYGLFYGVLRNAQTRQQQKGDTQTTVLQGVSDAERLSRTIITTSLFQNINAGSLFSEILASASVASYAADALTDTIAFASYTDAPITRVLRDMVQAGNYRLFVDGYGTVRMKGRYADIFDTAVGSYSEFYDLSYNSDPDLIINQLKYNIDPKAVISEVSTLASITGSIRIPAQSHIGFWLAFQDPVYGGDYTSVGSIVTPVASTDYYASTTSDGTGTNLTSALSLNIAQFAATAVCSIYNSSASDAYLTRFQYRGYPLRSLGTVGFRTDASSSQSVYGLKALEISNSLIQDYAYLKALTQAIVEDYKEPRERVTPILINEFPDIVSNQVGDSLTMVNTITGVNSDWVITRMSHDVTIAGGLRHQVTYETEYFDNRPWLVLDHATMGVLDGGRILGL